MSSQSRSTLLFDGECGFCRRCVEWLRPQATEVDYLAYQDRGERFSDVPEAECKAAVQFIDGSGVRTRGAAAIYEVCALIPGLALFRWLYKKVPPFRGLSDWGYKWVASHRPLVSKISRWGMGKDFSPSSYQIVSWLFLRALGFIFFVAFLSLFFQIPGLFGTKGLAPAGEFLEMVSRHYGSSRYWELPTLAWISTSDGFLQFLCALGLVGSAALTIGFLSRVSASICWLCYLSLTGVGGVFMQYQWEGLLLEAGFLAIYLAPNKLWTFTPKSQPAPSRIVVFLYRWLLFRLMFASGIAKLASGDDTWRDFTALKYHFETQPLPTWLGWYAHQLPNFMLQIATMGMFVIELGVSLLILMPRRQRREAFYPLVALQVFIFLTGNYTYFNYLTMALCLFLLDDQYLLQKFVVLRRWAPNLAFFQGRARWKGLVLQGLLVAFVFGGCVRLLQTVGFSRPEYPPFSTVMNWANRMNLLNGYGLFASMTVNRHELVIEGSDDEKDWKAYVLPSKPQGLGEAPAFVAPHQPRLDWQMWFASLGLFENQKWLQRLSYRLLTNDPAALSLFEVNPFPDKAPKALRILRYRYQFTTPEEKANTGHWWKR
ncbi:MAG: lipase maturation factor family protein [Bdellovibrionaceae bacterium]|nr:lipase maturation factor family protein [Pseudobdellovibrionaceae bacterium]